MKAVFAEQRHAAEVERIMERSAATRAFVALAAICEFLESA